MSKLYPPMIGGNLPAFFYDGGKAKIKIPFQKNRLTGNNYDGFSMIVKNASNGKQLEIFETNVSNKETEEVIFEIPFADFEFKPGLFYKIQLAYFTNHGSAKEVGYYSNTSTIKCTDKPTLEVNYEPLDNSFGYVCYGTYTTTDLTEKVHSYRFDIYENENQLFESSGDCLHNSLFDDINGSSIDTYSLQKTLVPGRLYTINYTVTTINGLVLSQKSTPFFTPEFAQSESSLKPIASFNEEEGYVKIRVVPTDGSNTYPAGRFILKRKSSENNYETSELLYSFVSQGSSLLDWYWNDFTVKNGVSYQYFLQQYNENNIYSQEKYSSIMKIHFEHMFLYDGEKQLKIKFDPKVSSFKTNHLETKTDTIGGKYPMFYRNDIVSYKEFPVSGLISYHSDYEKLFMDWETEDSKYFNTNTSMDFNKAKNDIVQEQAFKIAVLNWLNNGQPKLFRSPVEGNYIIKLMNVSLNPNEVLGRMLHTFQATAYEVSDYTYQNLIKQNFIQFNVSEQSHTTLWREVKNIDAAAGNLISQLSCPAIALDILDVPPGTKFSISFNAGSGSETIIQVGATGEYHIPLSLNQQIYSLELIDSNSNTSVNGSIIYAYKGSIANDFNSVTGIVPSLSWNYGVTVGSCEDIIADIEESYDIDSKLNSRGKLIQFNKFGKLRFFKRPVVGDIYYSGNIYHLAKPSIPIANDTSRQDNFSGLYELNPVNLYRIIAWNDDNGTWEHTGYMDLYQSKFYRSFDSYWCDTKDERFKISSMEVGNVFFTNADTPQWTPKIINKEDYNCNINFNDSDYNIDITHTEKYNAPVTDMQYTSVKIGPGVYAEYLYKSTELQYDLDVLESETTIKNLKQEAANYRQQLALWQNEDIAPDEQVEGNTPYEKQASNKMLDRPGIAHRLAHLNSAKRAYAIALTVALYEIKMGIK